MSEDKNAHDKEVMKENRRTKISIALDKTLDCTGSHGASCKILPIELSRASTKSTSYYRIGDLRKTEEVDISFTKQGKKIDINLSPDMVKNLANYLSEERDLDPREDCASFVHRMKGVQFTPGSTDTKMWDFTQITQQNEVQLGDALFLGQLRNGNLTNLHFVLYLGEGIYISKGGNNSKLIATDMPNVMKFWPTDFVLKMEPARSVHNANYMPNIKLNQTTNFPKVLAK